MAKAPKPETLPETDQGEAAIEAAAPSAEASDVAAPSEPAVQEEAAAPAEVSEEAAPSEPAAQEEADPVDVLKIRIRTGRFPYRRAGHVFSGAGAWDELDLPVSKQNLLNLVAWIDDPAIQVEQSVNDKWVVMPHVTDEQREYAQQYADGEQSPKE